MNPDTASRLIEINRDFYTRFGDSFSATRRRIQPGVRRVLGMLKGDESILDLGCGNGEFARELARHGHSGPYLGVDFSLPLLRDAESIFEGFPAKFLQADLTGLSSNQAVLSSGSWNIVTAFAALHHIPSNGLRLDILQTIRRLLSDDGKFLQADLTSLSSNQAVLASGSWNIVTAFATLHHIPSNGLRLDILQTIRWLLSDNGKFIHSNWQFLNSEKLKARIKPWEDAVVRSSDVDAGDYLLDWRSGGEGLRYIHHFDEAELSALAEASGFQVMDSFYSDGEGGNLGLYQVWGINTTD